MLPPYFVSKYLAVVAAVVAAAAVVLVAVLVAPLSPLSSNEKNIVVQKRPVIKTHFLETPPVSGGICKGNAS